MILSHGINYEKVIRRNGLIKVSDMVLVLVEMAHTDLQRCAK